VDVVGFPQGGAGISITTGIVSRIDWGEYSHSSERNHVVTVDAAINGGNSGGPALSGSKVVGVAFQSYAGDADNIGFIIPVEVVKRVLEDFDGAKDAAARKAGKDKGKAVGKAAGKRAAAKAGKPSKLAAADGGDGDGDSGREAGAPALALRGFARFVPKIQRCENAALRAASGLVAGQSGVLVHEVRAQETRAQRKRGARFPPPSFFVGGE